MDNPKLDALQEMISGEEFKRLFTIILTTEYVKEAEYSVQRLETNRLLFSATISRHDEDKPLTIEIDFDISGFNLLGVKMTTSTSKDRIVQENVLVTDCLMDIDNLMRIIKTMYHSYQNEATMTKIKRDTSLDN